MPVFPCPYCRAANCERSYSCHCCGASVLGRADVRLARRLRAPAEEGQDLDLREQRSAAQDHHAATAARALLGAAAVMLVRGTVLPLLIGHLPLPAPLSFPHVNPLQLQLTSYALTAAFICLYAWALNDPLAAAVTAIVVYAAVAAPELFHNNDWLRGGVLSKAVMLSVLGRSLVAGLLHRSIRG